MTIRIDEERVTSLIEERHSKRIVFNAPDGLLKATREFAQTLEKKYPSLKAIVIADPAYGSCDTVDVDAQRLGADTAFHIGHAVTVTKFGKITYSIDAFDDISFSNVARIAAKDFLHLGYKTVGLATFAQHILELNKTAEIFMEEGIVPFIGKGLGQLHEGQIFGCEFYPAFNIKDKVDAMVLLGQSMFHALGLALSTGKPTFILDPYSNEVQPVQSVADERLKRSILSVFKARDAQNFCVIIGLKEGQIMTDQSIKIKEKLESFGKNVQLIALREITSDRLNALTGIEAFIQTGCPRISVDGYTFSKPVLSVPQTDALINLLSGKEITADIFVRKHWL
ncbi:MAG: diphthamide biosynthesis enzyme Dph2 [Nitrososphaerales archaeon]